jgi:type II secretory pathway component GspD/PulD (secretin)
MRRSVACILLMSAALVQPAVADYGLTIIPLRHRPAEQIVPSLRPLVEQGGAISSMGDKILLRVSPGNLAELRTAIAALDTPLRRLVVSVRQGEVREASGGGLGVDGRLAPGNSRVIIRGGAGSSEQRDDVSQQVQVVEGGRALIQVGQSLPLMMREWRAGPGGWVQVDSVRHMDVGTGFLAAPQVVGNQVTIEISPSMERIGEGGVVESSRLATTVSGALGSWIPLGGSAVTGQTTRYGTGGYAQGARRVDGQVWLRVDALD